MTSIYPSWTPYHYVHNNPLNMVDPTGMAACEDDNKICQWWQSLQENIGEVLQQAQVRMTFHFGEDEATAKSEVSQEQQMMAESMLADMQERGELIEAGYESAEYILDVTAVTADAVGKGSGLAALGGIGLTLAGVAVTASGIGAPAGGAMISSGISITGTAFTVGTVANMTSTVAKGVDAVAFDGSSEAVFNQFLETGFNVGAARLAPYARGGLLYYLERSTQATRVVSASPNMVRTASATVDATRVVLPAFLFSE